jgi:hypothetical protein
MRGRISDPDPLRRSSGSGSAVLAGAAYFALIFPVAFLLGVLRTLVLVPLTGELVAVALEVPVLLALTWRVARRLGRPVPATAGARVSMGLVAFALLMVAELALAVLILDMPAMAFLAGMTTAPGLLGLAGQIAFGLIPLVQLRYPERS